MFQIADKTIPLRGLFVLRVLDSKGNVVKSIKDENMIVNGARVAMSMLVGEGLDSKVITHFGVGTNTAPATPADTDLKDIYKNEILGHVYPELGTVRFSWRLNYDEANDKDVSEFGLFCADGTLFSRKVRESIYKAADIAFEGEWSIIF